MNGIQVLLLLFITYALYGVVIKLKKRELNPQLFVLWLFFWLIVATFVVIPNSLNYVADLVGVGRGVDVAIYVSILVLFYAVFRIFIRLEKYERNHAELVRKISIGNVTKGENQTTDEK